ncbi:MAG: hypothetical protein ACFFDQ_07005 [Candidatus Thorarchaeota archaeon]
MTLNLKQKIDEAVSRLKTTSDPNEVSTLIHRTPWVRILLDHYEEEEENQESFVIEVEMSFPEENSASVLDSSELIDRLFEHLHYLQKLKEVGFELSVIGTGCIYCASKELKEPPQDNLFRALIPPEAE